jgi:hypothetical protein
MGGTESAAPFPSLALSMDGTESVKPSQSLMPSSVGGSNEPSVSAVPSGGDTTSAQPTLSTTGSEAPSVSLQPSGSLAPSGADRQSGNPNASSVPSGGGVSLQPNVSLQPSLSLGPIESLAPSEFLQPSQSSNIVLPATPTQAIAPREPGPTSSPTIDTPSPTVASVPRQPDVRQPSLAAIPGNTQLRPSTAAVPAAPRVPGGNPYYHKGVHGGRYGDMHNYGNNDVQDKRPGGKSIRAFVSRDGKWFLVKPMKMKQPHKHPKMQKSSKSGGLKSIGSKASKGGYG